MPPARATRVHGSEEEVVSAASRGRRLPRRLVVAPGHYRVAAESFALEQPGVYRFVRPDGTAQQRLVTASSLDAVLGDLASLWAYGTADDQVPPRRRLRLVTERRLSLTCTALCTDIATVLRASGLKARVVLAFTRRELNEDDNGHTLLEVRSGGEWLLYDPTFRTYFRRDGRRLSLSGWCTAVTDDDYEIEGLRCALPSLGSFTPFSAALQARMERITDSEEARRAWYARVGGVPLVRVGKEFVFAADDPLAETLSAYSPAYRPLEPSCFDALWKSETEIPAARR